MARIPLPPPGIDTNTNVLFVQCVSKDDTLEIDVVDAGYVSIAPTGKFYPDIPTGHVDQGITTHAPTVDYDDIFLGYFDQGGAKVFLVQIQIRESCTSTAAAL